jgi:hypothetical protein
MPRYIRQRNNYSCGPVALLNALKWAGATKGTSYEMVSYWCEACRTTKRMGTSFIDLFRAARTLPLIGARKARPKVKLIDINAHLRHGGAVILGSFSESMNGFHWFLVTEKIDLAGEVSYRVVNFDRRSTQRLVSVKMIKKSLRLASKRSGYPRALFLRAPGKGVK